MKKSIRNFLIAGVILIVGWILVWAILTAMAEPFDDGTSGTFIPISTEIGSESNENSSSFEILPTETPTP